MKVPELMTPRQAATLSGYHPNSIHHNMYTGKLRWIRINDKVLIRREDFKSWLEKYAR